MSQVPIIQSSGTNPAEALTARRASRPWRVLHTCESVGDIAALIEGQLAVGMRPSIATPEGFVISADAFRRGEAETRAQISLLNAWNEVRHWRKILLEDDAALDCDLVHAHSFATGMAGVRNCPITVYEISSFIEDYASAGPGEGSWLSRSFRVAEQFVISRAAAVVVRTESMRLAVLRRGASPENVFTVPTPVAEDSFPVAAVDEDWIQSMDIDRWHRIITYAPDWKMELGEDGHLSEHSRGLLDAFAIAAGEEDGAYLLVECEAESRRAAAEYCENIEISTRVRFLSAADRQRAFDAAEIIVAGEAPSGSHHARHALQAGKTLLAADSSANRDVTPSGRGCLWYRQGDHKDIAHRLAFLARNRDFRISLAESGQRFIRESCDPTAVAMEYDRVYKRAIARGKSGGLQTPAIHLSPASVML